MMKFSLVKIAKAAMYWKIGRLVMEAVILDPWWHRHTPEGKLAIWLTYKKGKKEPEEE